jgi:TATA-box binding protein (TBP) (component of TFIID and TFIIIB)
MTAQSAGAVFTSISMVPDHGGLGRPVDLASIISHPPDSAEVHEADGLVRLETGTASVLVFGDGRAIVRGISSIPQAHALVASLLRL